LPLLSAALGSTGARAQQQVETSLPPSQRVTINLSSGIPGQSQWLYVKDQDNASFATPTFNDSGWTPVGIPHGANDFTSFLNTTPGGGDGDLNGGNNWYRLHFTLGTQYANSKVMVEFEGAHTGAQVYINGTLLPGLSAVTANAKASHVIGFIPFIVDLTPYLHVDGVTPNVLAVSVSRNNSWFEQPTFSGDVRIGDARGDFHFDGEQHRAVDLIRLPAGHPRQKKPRWSRGYLSPACVWRIFLIFVRCLRGTRRTSPSHSRPALY
jgi:beta-galactosidase